jgi:hypothetical protein
MRFTRESAAVAVSAPFMAAGLALAAVADDWPTRLGAAAMVMGASVVLAMTDRRARGVGGALAMLGALVAAASHFGQFPALTPH